MPEITCFDCGGEPEVVQHREWDAWGTGVTVTMAPEYMPGMYFDGQYVNIHSRCARLWWTCNFCGDAFRNPGSNAPRHLTTARVQRPSDYHRCAACEEEHDLARERDEDCDCDQCYQDTQGRLQVIKDYNYKPVPEFHGTGPLYLGAELEIAVSGHNRTMNAAELAQDRLGDLGYLKEDGSVPGFEIVTHPMSFSWAREHFPWGMLDDLDAIGCYPDTSCGMHVHVSREAFGGASGESSHDYRWMIFFQRNAERIKRMARRDSHYARFDHGDRHQIKSYAKGGVSPRYSAINTGNRDTYEVRVFASSLDPVQVEANLALVDASVRYAGEIDSYAVLQHGAWGWASFSEWVSARSEYAALSQKMEELQCVS